MNCFIKLYSTEKGEIKKFLNKFILDDKETLEKVTDEILELQLDYPNPVVMTEMIGVFIDNIDSFKINMWMSIDKDILINVTKNNANEIIKYLYERFPY